ncbi:MAG: hypothetical protein ACI9BO_002138 [Zhongshania sp.]|jgi:hypothetical protein
MVQAIGISIDMIKQIKLETSHLPSEEFKEEMAQMIVKGSCSGQVKLAAA